MELRTPSPAGPYFAEEAPQAPPTALTLHQVPPLHQLQQQQQQSQNSSQELVLWAVSDLKSVPPGALLIDPNVNSILIIIQYLSSTSYLYDWCKWGCMFCF